MNNSRIKEDSIIINNKNLKGVEQTKQIRNIEVTRVAKNTMIRIPHLEILL